MVGTLIKTHSPTGFFIGLIKNYFVHTDRESIGIGVTWNDCDETTETFHPYEDEYETCIYHFYDNGRWWRVDTNYFMFKQILEGKCK